MRRAAPIRVYNHIHCDECGQGHFEKDYHGDFICSSCGLILNDPLNTLYIPPAEDRPDDEPYDNIAEAFRSRQNKGVGIESIDDYTPEGKPNIFRGQWPRLQFCTITGKSFFARELIRTDATTGKKDYLCIVCLKAGKGRRSWHYLKRGKPQGYFEQAVLTAIKAVSKRRRRIGLNPPSVTDVVEFAERNFIIRGFNYSNVRDAVNLYEKRGVIRTVRDPITGSRRIILLAAPSVPRVVSEPYEDVIHWDDTPDCWLVGSHDFESYKPPFIGFEPPIHICDLCSIRGRPTCTIRDWWEKGD